MRRLLAISLALALSGCGAMRAPERVLVPVEVPCNVDVPSEPSWATKSLRDDSDIFDQVRALLAERKQRIAYQRILKAAIASCNSSPTAQASRLGG